MNDWVRSKKTVDVLGGHKMAYVEMGEGRPIIFQHGNPTSSYLWRNIMPKLAHLGRCIAIDLIGMGDSDKLGESGPDRYTFAEHSRYLEGALDALGINNDIVWVVHDWGSALGFDYIARHPERAAAVCYMEGIVKEMTWDELPESARDMFKTFRSPAGDEVVLDKNVFVERVLPASIIRELSGEEMDAYKAPFLNAGEDRRPTLTWPRQIPIEGEPEDVCTIVRNYGQHLSKSNIPKLFIEANPGMILKGNLAKYAKTWPNQTHASVKGLHFIQEDSPVEIADAISAWIENFS